MSLLITGLIIGLVMGLTGAGGALVAIPLFISVIGMDIKEASVFSLIAVVIASFSSYLSLWKLVNYKKGFALISISSVGSYLSAPYKVHISDFVIAILLTLVSIFALYSTWKKARIIVEGTIITSPSKDIVMTIIVGLALGVLTTFTGLGGGVLMVPVLMSFYRYNVNKAVATSLFIVTLSSLTSLIFQFQRGLKVDLKIDYLYMCLGIILANFCIRYLLKKVNEKRLGILRKVVFSLVVIFALIKIF